MTLVTGAELFTGNTALVTSAYMEGKTSGKNLTKNWVASYFGNFVGSLLLAYLAFKSGSLGNSPAAVNLAVAKCSAPWYVHIRSRLSRVVWIVAFGYVPPTYCLAHVTHFPLSSFFSSTPY